uniref:Transposase n=1 Tax=Heterorhabditis bacteriophora TaxID=37862 RepID=A0A1I7WAR0_HETBA
MYSVDYVSNLALMQFYDMDLIEESASVKKPNGIARNPSQEAKIVIDYTSWNSDNEALTQIKT